MSDLKIILFVFVVIAVPLAAYAIRENIRRNKRIVDEYWKNHE